MFALRSVNHLNFSCRRRSRMFVISWSPERKPTLRSNFAFTYDKTLEMKEHIRGIFFYHGPDGVDVISQRPPVWQKRNRGKWTRILVKKSFFAPIPAILFHTIFLKLWLHLYLKQFLYVCSIRWILFIVAKMLLRCSKSVANMYPRMKNSYQGQIHPRYNVVFRFQRV